MALSCVGMVLCFDERGLTLPPLALILGVGAE